MKRRFSLLAMCCTLLWCICAHPSFSRAATETPDGIVWTAIIPDAFPGYIYTWHLRSDGTYSEDGRDASTGLAIQRTLSGRWSVDGARMMLRQQDQPFVFDGVVLGGLYNGTLYRDGHSISRFCAAKGDKAPDRCGAEAGVA